MSDDLIEEERHLYRVLKSNGYDNTTIWAGSRELPPRKKLQS